VNKILQNCELEDRDIKPSDNEWYSDPNQEPEAARNYTGDDEAAKCSVNERCPTKIHHFLS
jgi:hypothetical protein